MPLIETRDLWKTYVMGEEEIHALRGVSVQIERGEYVAIMGPSGSGKSTLMNLIGCLDTPSSGRYLCDGVDLATLDAEARAILRRDKIGFVFQQFNLVPTLTAHENIVLPLGIAGRNPDSDWYDTVVDAVGLRDRLSHKPTELSGGQQQRVASARALLSRPDIVLADEPTGNLDSTASAEVLGFLRRSVDEFGQTIVMVTHDPNAAAYTDRVVFLDDGRVVAELAEPTADRVLERMKALTPAAPGDAQAG